MQLSPITKTRKSTIKTMTVIYVYNYLQKGNRNRQMYVDHTLNYRKQQAACRPIKPLVENTFIK